MLCHQPRQGDSAWESGGQGLFKGRRLLQGRVSTEHKSGEIHLMVWAQVPGPVSLSLSHLPCTPGAAQQLTRLASAAPGPPASTLQ